MRAISRHWYHASRAASNSRIERRYGQNWSSLPVLPLLAETGSPEVPVRPDRAGHLAHVAAQVLVGGSAQYQ